MRICYITHTRFPTEKAHGHQVAQVCRALAELSHDVTLAIPTVWTPIKDAFEHYGIPRTFNIKRLKTFDALHSRFIPNPLAFAVSMRSYRKALHQFLKGESFDLLYCRSQVVLEPLLASNIPVILELHTLPRRGRRSFVKNCNQCQRIVCLTTPMKSELVSWGVQSERVIVEGDAVSLDRFSSLPDKEGARSELKIRDLKKFTVGYAGSFKMMGLDKGVGLIPDAVQSLRGQSMEIAMIIVGGEFEEKEKEDIRKECVNPGTDLGYFDSEKMKLFFASCDLFIYPAPKTNHPYFIRDTSPLKIFEYMAAGKPIITADLPPIRDILDESTATFFKPGDSDDLARAIKEVFDNTEEAHKKAVRARKKVEEHTWERRMERILQAFTCSR